MAASASTRLTSRATPRSRAQSAVVSALFEARFGTTQGDGFTKDFSTQMLFGANEVELGKQWSNNKLLTSLTEEFKPFGCLRRGVNITVLIKQTSKEISGEFLGRLVLGTEDNEVKVFGATIY